MSWLDSLPEAVEISVEKYYEVRTNPSDQDKRQLRDRRIETREYRGLTFSAASDAVIGYPESSQTSTKTRSFYAIGGGGYTVVEIEDIITGFWFDDPMT